MPHRLVACCQLLVPACNPWFGAVIAGLLVDAGIRFVDSFIQFLSVWIATFYWGASPLLLAGRPVTAHPAGSRQLP